MLDKAIKGLEADEESEILDILAEQEKQELNKPLSGLESDLYYLDGIGMVDMGSLGLFGRLGLFKKLKQKHRTKKIAKLEKKGKTAKLEKYKGKIVKRDARAEKRKKVFQNVARMFNKVNPVTVAARNGLRLLVAINFFGLASKLKANPEVATKVRDLFRKMGGDVSKINKSIENGAKKKPLNKKTGQVKSLEGLEGFGNLGALIAIDALIKAAGKIVNKIFEWIKKKQAERKEKKAVEKGEAPSQPENSPIIDPVLPGDNAINQPPKKKLFARIKSFAQDKMLQKPPVQQDLQQQSEGEQYQLPQDQQLLPSTETLPINNTIKTAGVSNSKIGLWAAGIAGAAALAWFATSRPKPQLSGFKKLSGIKLK
jgi:SepF-like predicted cell division protein (DUF552 family)